MDTDGTTATIHVDGNGGIGALAVGRPRHERFATPATALARAPRRWHPGRRARFRPHPVRVAP